MLQKGTCANKFALSLLTPESYNIFMFFTNPLYLVQKVNTNCMYNEFKHKGNGQTPNKIDDWLMFEIDSFSFFSFGPVAAPSAAGHSFSKTLYCSRKETEI